MRPYKPRDPAVTSRIMARVRAKENRTEVALRKALWRRGFRHHLYDRLPGRPDLSFRSRRTVVFVDGDFWHGRILQERGSEALAESFRTVRREWWIAKIMRNVADDRRAEERLRALDWRIIRIWESDVMRDVEGIAERVARELGSVLPR